MSLDPNIKCDHCGYLMDSHREQAMAAIIAVSVPGAATDVQHIICAVCLLDLGEFLCPALLTQPGFQDNRELAIRRIMEARG